MSSKKQYPATSAAELARLERMYGDNLDGAIEALERHNAKRAKGTPSPVPASAPLHQEPPAAK
jgi:hypothetical protein